MRQKYKAKIKKMKYSGKWREEEIEFSHIPFQHYLKYYHVGREKPRRDGGSTRERIVKDLHKIKGFNCVKLAPKTLKTGYGSGTRSEKIPDIVRKAIEQKLEKEDYSIDDICKAGIPDLIVFRLPKWHQLSGMLPPLQNVKIDEDEREISLITNYDEMILNDLIGDFFFVEVKSWETYLNEKQEEWFEEFGEILDGRVFTIKRLNTMKEDYDSIDLENPWRLEE